MDIKNIKSNDKGFYYYVTDEFVTIDIRHYFNYENTKENCIKAMILSEYLIKTNDIYTTSKQITDRLKELYGLNIFISRKVFGSKTNICFELKMVNPRVIDDDYFYDAINFYRDIMLKPNFHNNKLNKEIFSLIKNELMDKKKDEIKTPNIMNSRLFYKNIIPNSDINNHNFIDIIEFENIINKINDKDIIDFYNELMNNYISSFAFGNLLDKEIKTIEKIFKFVQIHYDYKYDVKDKVIDKDILISNDETSQSYIYFVYDIGDYNKNNSYIYDALITMLCNNNGPIYNIYRTKLGIVYSSYAQILYNKGLLYIEADIDKINKEKAINGLKEIFDMLHDRNEIDKLLKYAKERRKELINSYSEDVNKNIEEIENYILKFELLSEEKLKLINKLTVDDIIKQINNLEYKCMYFYKGDKNEK